MGATCIRTGGTTATKGSYLKSNSLLLFNNLIGQYLPPIGH